jgi:hypothetical protein
MLDEKWKGGFSELGDRLKEFSYDVDVYTIKSPFIVPFQRQC